MRDTPAFVFHLCVVFEAVLLSFEVNKSPLDGKASHLNGQGKFSGEENYREWSYGDRM